MVEVDTCRTTLSGMVDDFCPRALPPEPPAGWTTSGAHVLCPPQRTSKRPWPTPWRRWLAGVRQMVETVQEKRPPPFRLDRDRPHALSGWPARLAARMALHNFCLWVHEQLGRPRRAFADLVD